MSRNLPLFALSLLLLAALAAAACGSSKGAPASTPTPSAASATAREEAAANAIARIMSDYLHFETITIDGRTYLTDGVVDDERSCTDSWGNDWAKFAVHFTPWHAPDQPVPPTATDSGLVKREPGGNWELAAFGQGDIQCGIPPDAQTALGFDICPASEEELNNAIRSYTLARAGPNIKDVTVDSKKYYTDSSGTDWVQFVLSPLPIGVTDDAYGFMKKVPGGDWQGVAGPGTAEVECSLPLEVQLALSYHSCEGFPTPSPTIVASPQSPEAATAAAVYTEQVDKAITDFVVSKSTARDVKVLRTPYYTDSSGTVWLAFTAMATYQGTTAPLSGVMRKTEGGDWEGVSGPGNAGIECGLPKDVQSALGFLPCASPTP